jgi:PhzF family phenazine biosynthesis protein
VPEVRLRTVDAFTDTPFTGNPAAVVELDTAPPDEWLAAVARETGLSDTAFIIREALPDADFRLRWFTPEAEVDLCGHATLASAHCLFEDGAKEPIRFATRSGLLTVARRDDGSLVMDFPASVPVEVPVDDAVSDALGAPVQWTGRSKMNNYLLARLADEQAVRELTPNLTAVGRLDAFALIVTAAADPQQQYDFVSRVFAPKAGIDEDPVTGSSHTLLGPYWSAQLGRSTLLGFQVSGRPGLVGVEMNGDRVAVSGRAVTVFDGILRAGPEQ